MKKLSIFMLLLVFVGFSTLQAQVRQISGTVTSSDDGEPLPGVSVVVKGTTVGITTNIDGEYTLNAPQDATTLVFTFVGMATKEVEIGTQTTINVQMEPDVVGLDEVVVTAFGISREKKAVAYQTESLSGDKLMTAQNNDATAGLVGKIAGLQVNVQDNGVKPNTQLLLRGLRSIRGDNEALVVIDGSIATASALSDLNPNDIESINVLKGATAAALYGSQAGNGAIMVTTKTGKQNQRFTIGYIHTYTVEEVSFMPDFQTEHGTGWDGEYNNIENTNWGPRFDGTLRQIGPTFEDGSYQEVPYAPVKNNLYDFYEKGITTRHTIYLTGGDESGAFYMSAGKQNTTGIVPEDTYSRTNFRINADKKIGKVKLGTNISYFSDDQDVVGDQIGDQDRALYWFVLNTPANIPLSSYSDWENPESFGYADNYFNAFYQNPYWAVGTNRNLDKTNRLIGNISASWDIIKNINFTTRLGVNNLSGRGKNWRAYQDYDPVLQPYHTTVSSFVEDNEFEDIRYTFDALLSGDFNLTEDISLKAIVGSAVYSRSYEESFIRANNLSIRGFYDISNGTGQLDGRRDASDKRTVGFFGDIAIGFRNFIFLNATGRQDYTSTLQIDDNSYFYPSVGLSLILTEAIPSLKNNILSYAKITANNSTVYNDLDPYQINERYSQDKNDEPEFPFPYDDVNGFYKARTAVDANIKKEKLNSTEIGLNLAFLNGRITLDGAYFITKTTDLITPTTPSRASGAEFYLTNIGELKGSGYDLALGATVVKMNDFEWDLNLNYYSFETEVVKITEGIDETFIQSYLAGYGIYAVVGEPFPMLKAKSYVRDDQGRIVVDKESGNPIVGEVKNMGKTVPDYIVGLTSAMSYKGLTLSATADYRGGYVYYSQGSDQMEFTGRSMESVSSDRQNFVWPNSVYQDGTDANGDPIYVENTNIPITDGNMSFWQNRYNEIKENYVKDATAFKLRELSLTYSIPSSLLQKTQFIQKLEIGLVGRNLITYLPNTKYRFSDPEFKNTRNNAQTYDPENAIGIGGFFTSPPTRTYGFSINVEF